MYDIKPITSKHETDCGATCLKMLLEYYGIEADLQDLIAACNTGVVGCTLGDLKRAADAKGLTTHAYKMDWDELIRQDRPAIIWWMSNHYCVFCGVDENDQVILNNPDTGRYHVPLMYFKMLYTGVALFNGEPVDTDLKLLAERVNDNTLYADMALVNSELALALMEVM